jgi:hypothetical protein
MPDDPHPPGIIAAFPEHHRLRRCERLLRISEGLQSRRLRSSNTNGRVLVHHVLFLDSDARIAWSFKRWHG